MGISQSKRYSKSQQPQFEIDVKKDLLNEFKILTNWSLQQVRDMCLAYYRYSCDCPYLSRFTFKKILTCSTRNSNQIFQAFSQGQRFINFYELFCIVILTSFNTFKRKLQFMYLIFNFTHDQTLKMKHFILMYECMVFGFCRITNQQLPKTKLLRKHLLNEYLKSDANEILQRNFSYRKLIQQVEINSYVFALFQRFQHNQDGIKQKPSIYMLTGLHKYIKSESIHIFKVIKKANQDKNFQDVQLYENNKLLRLQNRRTMGIRQVQDEKLKILQATNQFRIKNRVYSLKADQNHNKITFRGNLLATTRTANLDQIDHQKLDKTVFNLRNLRSNSLKSYASQQKLGNSKKSSSVFLGGKSYTKNAFFQTIQYFNSLSNNKQQIKIKQFFKTFQKKSFLKTQLTAIFNHLDINHDGSISFQQFIKSSYPQITKGLLKKVMNWNLSYKKIYQADKITIQKQLKTQDIQLPTETMIRIENVFKSIAGHKAYIDYQDLRTNYINGFTLLQCQQVVKEFGVDGRIYIEGFAKTLLPLGYYIQGCTWDLTNR